MAGREGREGEVEPTPGEKEILARLSPAPTEKDAFIRGVKADGVRKELGQIGPGRRWGRRNSDVLLIALAVIVGLALFFLIVFFNILG
ncbi:MAG TPA: hypothetical protein VMB35_08350 [Methanomicrobiales archaeon]|nr:hypothetical protein [Methanomicrobiales archaeon]